MYLKSEPSGVQIGVWKITEEFNFFFNSLHWDPSELQLIDSLKGSRKIEWVASRYVLHILSGRKTRGACLKDEFGKPYLEDSDWHISLSHSHEWIAVIAHPKPCGIDIQFKVEKITAIAHKFLHPDETELIPEDEKIEFQHVYWGAKECLYKAYGRKALNFADHIRIERFENGTEGKTQGSIIKDELREEHRIHFKWLGSFLLVYSIKL